MLTETAATSERLTSMPLLKLSHGLPLTSEIEMFTLCHPLLKVKGILSFARMVPFLFTRALPILSVRGFWEFLHFCYIILFTHFFIPTVVRVYIIFFVLRSSLLRKAFELSSFEFHEMKIIKLCLVLLLVSYSLVLSRGKGSCSLLF